MRIMFLAASAALATLIVSAASAADVGVRIPHSYGLPAPAPVSVFEDRWTGVYAGVTAGYGWGEIENEPARVKKDPRGTEPQGWALGGTLGAQKQFGAFVVGVETDLNWANLKDSREDKFSSHYCWDECGSHKTKLTNRLDFFGTARGRVGVAFGDYLPYVTAGAAFGRVTSELHHASSWGSSTYTAHNWAGGWTAGGGLEVALGPNLSAKAEYLFAHLNGPSTSYSSSSKWGRYSFKTSTDLDAHIVRVGLNYRF